MKNRMLRLSLGVVIGVLAIVGLIWLLSQTMGWHEPLYAGKPIGYWQAQANSHDTGISNQAYAIINAKVIPQLVDAMFHDTNDSSLRLEVINLLNGIPGIEIRYMKAKARRCYAAANLGNFGPPARAAVPELIRAVKGNDPSVQPAAVMALGQIHSDPDLVIPLLIGHLDDEKIDNSIVAIALGNFGSLSKAAVPKLIPMLKAPEKEDRAAAKVALQKIDPDAYLNAIRVNQSATNNVRPIQAEKAGTPDTK